MGGPTGSNTSGSSTRPTATACTAACSRARRTRTRTDGAARVASIEKRRCSRTEPHGCGGAGLFGCVRHVVDGVHDRLIGKIRAPAFRRHHAGFALEAFEGVLVKYGHPLREPRCPCPLVPKPRSAGNPGAVTGDARRGVDLLARKHSRGSGRSGDHRGGLRRFERAVVLTGDGDSRWRGEASGKLLPVFRIVLVGFGPGAARHVADEENHADDEPEENPHGSHEPVTESAVVGCAHNGLTLWLNAGMSSGA